MLERIGWPVAEADVEVYRHLLEYSIGFNPRSVKRLCNTLLLLKNVAEITDEDRERAIEYDTRRLEILFGLVCLEAQYEPVYGVLRRTDDKDLLAKLSLEPDTALEHENFTKLNLKRDFQDQFQQLVEFMKVLGRIVDANMNHQIDDEERAVLEEMMSLSAITSVAAEPRKTRLSSDELMDVADTRRVRHLLIPLRDCLHQVSNVDRRLRERRSLSTFSYDLNMNGEPWSGWLTVLQIRVKGEPGRLWVGLGLDRLRKAQTNTNPSQSQAIESLRALLQSTGAQDESGDGNWWAVPFTITEDVDSFVHILRQKRPFDSGAVGPPDVA